MRGWLVGSLLVVSVSQRTGHPDGDAMGSVGRAGTMRARTAARIAPESWRRACLTVSLAACLHWQMRITGVPIRTFDAPLADWANSSKLGSYDMEVAAAAAARLLGVSAEEVRVLLEAQKLLPPLPAERADFASLGNMVRYFRATGIEHDTSTRAALSSLWQEMVEAAVRAAPASESRDLGGQGLGGQGLGGHKRASGPAVAQLFERIGSIARKPARFTIRFRRLRVGLELRRGLAAACDAVAASLASSGAEHSSARSVLERFRLDASASLAALTRSLHTAAVRLAGTLVGGETGLLRLLSHRIFFEGGLALSRLISPPAAKPYAVHARLLTDGRLRVLLSLSPASDSPSQPPPPDGEMRSDCGGDPSQADHSASAAACLLSSSSSAPSPPTPTTSHLQLLSLHVSNLTASLMVGPMEALRLTLVQQSTTATVASAVAPALPALPPLPTQCDGDAATDGAPDDKGCSTREVSVLHGLVARPLLSEAHTGGSSPPHAPAAGRCMPAPTMTPASTAITARPTRLVEVFENQRRLTSFRAYSAADLLPLDPGCWSDELCTIKYDEIDLVPLPLPPSSASAAVEVSDSLPAESTAFGKGASVLAAAVMKASKGCRPDGPGIGGVGSASQPLANSGQCGSGRSAGDRATGSTSLGGGGGVWQWVDKWTVDKAGGGKGEDGWQYALNWNTGWLSASNPITLVRRRRWVRHAELWLPAEPASVDGPSHAPHETKGAAAHSRRAFTSQWPAEPTESSHPPLPPQLLTSEPPSIVERKGTTRRRVDAGPTEHEAGKPQTQDNALIRPGSSTVCSPLIATETAPPTMQRLSKAHTLLAERSHAVDALVASQAGEGDGVGADGGVAALAGGVGGRRNAHGGGGGSTRGSGGVCGGGGSGGALATPRCSAAGTDVPTTVPPTPSMAQLEQQPIEPSGAPLSPLLAGGAAALLQLSTAPGARVRIRGQHLEVESQPTLLFDHMKELLQELLTRHPWYAEPLRVASERARKHLASKSLRVTSSLKIDARVEGDECYVTIEGVPDDAVSTSTEAAHASEVGEMDQADLDQADPLEASTDATSPAGGAMDTAAGDGSVASEQSLRAAVCATFTNEVNLLDLVADVQDIYRSFTTNIATSQTPRPAAPSVPTPAT